MFAQKNMLNEPLKEYNVERYFAGWHKMNHENAKFMLLTTKRAFEEHDITFMPEYATLLGAVREHGFIASDADSDCMIWAKDMQKALDLMPELEKYGINLHCYVLPWIFTLEYKGETCDIDIFHEPIWPWRKWFLLTQSKYIPRHFFDNTAPLEFLGEIWTAPAEYEKLMEYYYGKTWRVPSMTNSRTESYWFWWRYLHRYIEKKKRSVKRLVKRLLRQS